MYVRFVYVPPNICYYTQGQDSGLMDADPINMIHTIQQSTKERLKTFLEEIFRNTKKQYLMNE